MTRVLFFYIAFLSFAVRGSTQAGNALAELAGTTTRQWSVIGTTLPSAAACASGEGIYTFQLKPAQVVVQKCAGGEWRSTTEAITSWSKDGKSGIAFGGDAYVVKSLPASAPVCKGNARCIRLASVPDGKTDATRTIYLTR